MSEHDQDAGGTAAVTFNEPRQKAASVVPPRSSKLLARGAVLLDPDTVARAASAYRDDQGRRERDLAQVNECLKQLREVHGQYPQLRDRAWCERPANGAVVDHVEALHAAIDRIEAVSPQDPDYYVIRAARCGWTPGDYVAVARMARDRLNTETDPALVRVSSESMRIQLKQGAPRKFFFWFDHEWWAPLGYQSRAEVRRIVQALEGLRIRARETAQAEREEMRKLLTEHPVPAEFARVVSFSDADGLDAFVRVAVYCDGLAFSNRRYSGVVLFEFGPGKDERGNTVAGKKRIRAIRAVGDIRRVVFPRYGTTGDIWEAPLVHGTPTFNDEALIHGKRKQTTDERGLLEKRIPGQPAYAVCAYFERTFRWGAERKQRAAALVVKLETQLAAETDAKGRAAFEQRLNRARAYAADLAKQPDLTPADLFGLAVLERREARAERQQRQQRFARRSGRRGGGGREQKPAPQGAPVAATERTEAAPVAPATDAAVGEATTNLGEAIAAATRPPTRLARARKPVAGAGKPAARRARADGKDVDDASAE